MDQYVIKNQKKLRCGITTGTCAAAAAAAATARLLAKTSPEEIRVHTPAGITVSVPVSLVPGSSCEAGAEYLVVKDSGDDPDVTNHAEIHVRAEKLRGEPPEGCFCSPRYPFLFLDGGEGVGRVTRAGLEQKPGQAAINRVPREMIFQAAGEICRLADFEERLLLLVKVPGGEKMAEKTFNPRLGIRGGISILGTSGILEPMSEKAILDTIETEIRQQHELGERSLLVVPGNYGQGYVKEYLGLDPKKSVQCSNYIGDTLDLAVSYKMEDFLLVGNIGKLVKLAAGIMNTHSKVADARCEIMAAHAVLCGGDGNLARQIMECVNTEEMLQLLESRGLREQVIKSLCGKIHEVMNRRSGSKMRCGAVLFSESFGFLGQTEYVDGLLKKMRSIETGKENG